MIGPAAIARTLSTPRAFGKDPRKYTYHPRSDHHSKLACWCIAIDLLAASALLRQHVADGKVTIGVNHTMTDFKLSRKKDLDLVIARPAIGSGSEGADELEALRTRIAVELTAEELAGVASLPKVHTARVGAVLVALEAKACMTEHGKARPRLFDELNSSQQTVHGAADQAIAVGLAMVNAADSFVSPLKQPKDPSGGSPEVTLHKQPHAAESVIAKLRELPRRSGPGSTGFDALGIMVIDLRNDGSPVVVKTGPPAPGPGDQDTYEAMVTRTAALYDFRFSHI